jgi:hypothetical protein
MVQFKTDKLLCKHAMILGPDFGPSRPWELSDLSRNLEFATAALHKTTITVHSGFVTELLLFCNPKHESHHTLAMSSIQWQVTTMQGNRLGSRESAIFPRLALRTLYGIRTESTDPENSYMQSNVPRHDQNSTYNKSSSSTLALQCLMKRRCREADMLGC